MQEPFLTPKQSEAWELRKQGLTYFDIAEELDISEGSVKDRLARAKHHINGTKPPTKNIYGKKLCPKEAEILDLKIQGLSHLEIAEKANISVRTVKNYMHTIKKKGVHVKRRYARR